MVLFLRNKRFNFMLFWADYYLRWWRLPIEERAFRKTDLGGGDYYLRNSMDSLPTRRGMQGLGNVNVCVKGGREKEAGVRECKCARKRGPGEGCRGWRM